MSKTSSGRLVTTAPLAALIGAVVCVSSTAHAADDPQLTAFFNPYCTECHAGEKPKGHLRLSTIEAAQWDNADGFLVDILEALEAGDMPTKKAKKQPDRATVDSAIALLKAKLDALASPARGTKTLKRLTRVEYQNTVNDVFGTDLDLLEALPPDADLEEGFANEGERLFMSPGSVEQYMGVAIKLSEKLIRSQPPVQTWTYSAGVEELHYANQSPISVERYRKRFTHLGAQPFNFCLKFDPPEPGEYEIVPHGVFFSRHEQGQHIEKIELETIAIAPERATFLYKTTDDLQCISHHQIRGPRGSDEGIIAKPLRVRLYSGRKLMVKTDAFVRDAEGSFVLHDPKNPAHKDAPRYNIWCKSVTVRGPLYDQWPPKEENPYQHFDGTHADDTAAVDAVVARLAEKLFRRPLAAEQIKPLRAIAREALRRKGNRYDAVAAALAGMLSSPSFLYKYESDSASLDDYAVATRLSYFLWNTLPDDELLALAKAGKLRDPDVRRQQARRMLEDPRSKRFAHDFTHQWLQMHKLKQITPNKHLLKGMRFNEDVHKAMEQEPIEFFNVVMRENLSITNFIDAEFLVFHPGLSWNYGHMGGKDWRKVEFHKNYRAQMLKKGREVGGLLTQPGFLLMTSDGETTNPIYRGVWVLQNLYGKKLKTPELVEALPSTVTSSIREKLIDHRRTPQCATCHKDIDPLGLALEGIDVLGRNRSHYVHIKETKLVEKIEKKDGAIEERVKFEYDLVDLDPVDANGKLSDGQTLAGLAGLKAKLMADRGVIAKALIGKLFSYAMSREHGYYDRPAIDAIFERTRADDHRLADILAELVASDAFTQR